LIVQKPWDEHTKNTLKRKANWSNMQRLDLVDEYKKKEKKKKKKKKKKKSWGCAESSRCAE
jgi:hypothetical protein